MHRPRRIHAPCAMAAALASLCSSSAWAEPLEAIATVTIHGSAVERETSLARETGVASRLELSALDTPASVESLSAATIAARGDVRLKDAVSRGTGLSDMSSPGNGIAYSARGFGGNNAVAMLEDGQRLLVGSGTATTPASPWGYQAIEILRGPGSVVHGSGTTGATINAVRKAPQRTASLEAMAAAGEGGTLRAGVGGSGALGTGGAFRIDAYADHSDGFIDRAQSRHAKLMTGATQALSETLDLDLQFDLAREHPQRYFGTPLVEGALARELRRENYNVGDAEIAFANHKALARLNWRVTPALTLSHELAHMTARRDWRNAEHYEYDAASRQVERSDYIAIRHDQEQTANRLEARWRQGANRLVAGWEAATVNFRHTNNSPYGGASTVAATGFDPGRFDSPDPLRPNFETDTLAQALYLEDVYSANERLLLLAGVRRDRYKVERVSLLGAPGFASTLASNAVRLGLTWKLDADTALYGQVSTGSDPLTSLLSLNLANARYRLTRSRQVEAGVKGLLDGGRSEWTLAVYRIRKDDIVTRDPANPALSIQGGAQSSRGIEASAAFPLSPAWRLDANAAYTDARFDRLVEAGGISRAGKRPSDVPELSANLWLGYKLGAWRAAAGARHVGARYIDNGNTRTLPAYTSFDATLAWQPRRDLTLQLALRNLGDKLYALTSYGDSQYLLGERRHAELALRWKY